MEQHYFEIIMMLLGILGTIGFGLSAWTLLQNVDLKTEVAVLKAQQSRSGEDYKLLNTKLDEIQRMILDGFNLQRRSDGHAPFNPHA